MTIYIVLESTGYTGYNLVAAFKNKQKAIDCAMECTALREIKEIELISD